MHGHTLCKNLKPACQRTIRLTGWLALTLALASAFGFGPRVVRATRQLAAHTKPWFATTPATRANLVPLFATTYFVRTDGSDAVCNGLANASAAAQPNCAFATISKAVMTAANGDTINVAAGTYPEMVTVNKSLSLHGAQFGVDARTRAGAETIVTGNAGSTAFYVPANNVTLDGFTVQGQTNVNLFGAGVYLGAGTSGAQVRNNIFQNNVVGLFLANATGGNQAVLQHNLFSNNNQPGAASGSGIYSDQYVAGGTVNNVLIDSNKFTGNNNAGVDFSADDPTKGASNVTISNNEFAANARAMLMFNLTSSAITGNYIHDSTWDATADIRIYEGNNNLTITGNTLIKGAGRALRIGNVGTGAGNAANITVNCNRIIDYGVAGAVVDAGQYTGTLNAENNWWGCNAGPGGAGCNIASGAVDFAPWYVLSLTAVPPNPMVGTTSTLTASLKLNSDGVAAPCGGVPNGAPVSFTATGGTVNPANATMTGGMTMATYTPGVIAGPFIASTTVDNQTLTTPIAVTPPDAILSLNAKISDPAVCLDPGGIVGSEATVTNLTPLAQPSSWTATLPGSLTAVPGTCVTALTPPGGAPGTCTMAGNGGSLSWNGTLAAGQTVTIIYRARLSAGAGTGQLCIFNQAMVGNIPRTLDACFSVACPNVVNARASDQKAGSVLVFPYYTSTIGGASDTRMTISHVSNAASTAANQTYVHLFFIDGITCQQQDLFLCLTPNASFAFTASEYDPGNTGYVIAVAVNKDGLPVQNNVLIGNAFVNTSQFADNYGAESFRANSFAVATVEGDTATLYFDHTGYDAVPKQFAVEVQSPADAVGQQIVTAGLSGNLATTQITGAAQLGAGQACNEQEIFVSFSGWLSGTCQARGTISAASPRVANGFGNLIKAGQSGSLKFNVGAAVGLLFTPRTATWKGIRTLHKTQTTTTTLTIPLFVPVC